MKQYFEKQLDEMVRADIQNRPYISNISLGSLKHYPTHLYKYRDGSKEHHFEMIKEGYLWADIPTSFDDPVDSLVNYKFKSELPSVQKWVYQHLGELLYYYFPPQGMRPQKRGQSLSAYIDAQNKFTDSTGRYSAKKAKRLMLVETRKLHPNEQQKLQKIYERFEGPEFEEKLRNSIQGVLLKAVNILRERNLVCCLTQRKDNQKMWEDYAGKYTGFVIEYDLSRTVEQADISEVLAHMFPVTYYRRSPKVPILPFIQRAFYRKIYNKEFDVFDPAKKLYRQLLVKKEEYRGEEEWRILSSSQRIEFPTISAVYMGYNIKANDAQLLTEICAEKGIPLYKQEFHPFTGIMRFVLVRGEVVKV